MSHKKGDDFISYEDFMKEPIIQRISTPIKAYYDVETEQIEFEFYCSYCRKNLLFSPESVYYVPQHAKDKNYEHALSHYGNRIFCRPCAMRHRGSLFNHCTT